MRLDFPGGSCVANHYSLFLEFVSMQLEVKTVGGQMKGFIKAD